MSKIISFATILLVCTIIGNSEAFTMRAVFYNDAHPGKCFVSEDFILNPGQVAEPPEGCSEIHCENEKGHAQIIGCSTVGAPPNCKWDGLENEKAPFPVCCVEKYVCDNPADEEDAKKIQEHLRNMYKQQAEQKKKH